MSTIIEDLQQVCREVFADDAIVLTRETTANSVDGWDSFSHMNLILAIEMKFNIVFKQREAFSFANVGELVDCIQRKITP